MQKSVIGTRGMVVAPHYLAAQSGVDILREGGSALEAAVATAASLCSVYPHMTGIGGDAFWTIYEPESGQALCIDASGSSGAAVSFEAMKRAGISELPRRGAWSAITVGGAVSGWEAALQISAEWQNTLPLARLLEDATFYAENGYPVSSSQHALLVSRQDELAGLAGFSETFLKNGTAPATHTRHKLPALGRVFRQLAAEGLSSFYRGNLAKKIADDLHKIGSPLLLEDLNKQQARRLKPLQTEVSGATLYNCPPPCQGVSSLMILGIYDAFIKATKSCPNDGASLVHTLVEATKLAFSLRDSGLADPEHMSECPENWLKLEHLQELARKIKSEQAIPWGTQPIGGDTVWFGVVDAKGRAVSCIQSIYFEFGSGLVLPECGFVWHNRGLGFSLDSTHPNALSPCKKPFHTLNPALACFADGRVMPYGTMGGEGQPQTQAALFSRYAWLGYGLQAAISAPRWLLGRTWGDTSTSLKLEADFTPEIIQSLQAAGHVTELVPAKNELMGHAGAIVAHPDGLLEGASDPRCDGIVATW